MNVSLSILYWIDIEIAATVGSSWVSTVYLPHQLLAIEGGKGTYMMIRLIRASVWLHPVFDFQSPKAMATVKIPSMTTVQ